MFRRYGFDAGTLITDEADNPIEAGSLPYLNEVRNIVLEDKNCDPPFLETSNGCFSNLQEWANLHGNGTQESLPLALRCRTGVIP